MTLGRTLRVDPASLPAAGVRLSHDSLNEDYRWSLAHGSSGECSPTNVKRLQKSETLRGQALKPPRGEITLPEPSPGPRNKPDHHFVDDIPFSGPAPRPGLTLIQPLGSEQAPQLSSTGSFRPAPSRETNPLSPTYRWGTSHDAVGVYPLGPPSPTLRLPPSPRGAAPLGPPSPTLRLPPSSLGAAPASTPRAAANGLSAAPASSLRAADGISAAPGSSLRAASEPITAVPLLPAGPAARGGSHGAIVGVAGIGGCIPDLPLSPTKRSGVLEVGDIKGAVAYPRTRSRQASYSAFDYSDVPGTSSKPSSPVRQRLLAGGRPALSPIDPCQRGMWAGAVGAVPEPLRRTQRTPCDPNAPEYRLYGQVISDEAQGLGKPQPLLANTGRRTRSNSNSNLNSSGCGFDDLTGPESLRRSWQDPGEGGLVGAMQALQATGARTWPHAGAMQGPSPRHGLPGPQGRSDAKAHHPVGVGGAAGSAGGAGGGGGGGVRAQREHAAAVAEVAALV